MSELHYTPISASKLMEYLSSGNDNEYLTRINTFCKYHIDTHKTFGMNLKSIVDELASNGRGGIYFKSYGSVYHKEKPGPRGHKAFYSQEYGVEVYCSFYSAVRFVLEQTPCFNINQVRSERMREYWQAHSDIEVANLVCGNEWNKFEAHKHLSNIEYERMLQWEAEGCKVFRVERKKHKPHKTHKPHKPHKTHKTHVKSEKQKQKEMTRLEAIRNYYQENGNLLQRDRLWLSNNGYTVADL